MSALIKLSLKQLKRGIKNPLYWLLFFAIILAVTTLSGVSLLSERIEGSISEQAKAVIGGDLQLRSSQVIPDKWLNRAQALGLLSSQTVETQSMIFAGDELQLVSLKAVDDTYPLKGVIALKNKSLLVDVKQGPRSGEIWLEQSLAQLLKVNLGENVEVGNLTLAFTQVIGREPDASNNWLALSPRAMLALEDLPKTGIAGPGSRATYRAMFSGEKFQRLIDEVKQLGDPSLRVQSYTGTNSRSIAITEQATKLVRLTSIVALILACIAIGLVSNQLISREQINCALYRTLGLKFVQILGLYALFFIYIGMAAAFIGCLLGFGLQYVLAGLIYSPYAPILPAPSWQPIGFTLLVTAIILMGFTLPALLRIEKISPMTLLRDTAKAQPLTSILVIAISSVAMLSILAAITNDMIWTLLFAVAFIIFFAIIYIFALALSKVTVRCKPLCPKLYQYGILRFSQQLKLNFPQLFALVTTLAVSAILTMTASDLFHNWHSQIDQNTPNFFAYNITPAQIEPMQAFLASKQIAHSDAYAMIRGRIIKVNGRVVDESLIKKVKHNSLRRALNMTYTSQLPAKNEIIKGRWFESRDNDSLKISIEQDMAAALDVELGDTMTFSIADKTLKAKILSIRKVDWNTFSPNFYVIFAPESLEQFERNYVTSFHLDPNDYSVLHELAVEFNQISLIDVQRIFEQVSAILSQMQQATSLIMGLTLVSAIVVISIMHLSMQKQKQFELGLFRALGLSRSKLRKIYSIDTLMLATLSCLLSAAFALLINYYITVYVLKITYSIQWKVLILTFAISFAVYHFIASKFLRDSASYPTINLLK